VEKKAKPMDLIERIEDLRVLVEGAKAVPLSASAVINRDEFLELLAQLKQGIPDEVRRARWMLRDREEFISRARKEAQRIIADARDQRGRLLSRTEIMAAADRESERIMEEANERATRMRLEAEDYIDQKLAAFEIFLNKTQATVKRGRSKLRATNRSSVEMPIASEMEPPPEGPFDADELNRRAV
jgi:regulator of protease activity HflC (stomatin/prohibitin superfamily)